MTQNSSTSRISRTAVITRETAETAITLKLNLDGNGVCSFRTPVGFLNHMLTALCKHGLFDLEGTAAGDMEVDQHHLVEDTGIVLGSAFDAALGSRAGIMRAGFCIYPMDETLARAAVDFGGRAFLVCEADLSGIPLTGNQSVNQSGICGAFQTDTFEDFWQGFVSEAKCNLHLDVLRGRSDHHKMEALFKAAARALRDAVLIDGRRNGAIPSTKGIIC